VTYCQISAIDIFGHIGVIQRQSAHHLAASQESDKDSNEIDVDAFQLSETKETFLGTAFYKWMDSKGVIVIQAKRSIFIKITAVQILKYKRLQSWNLRHCVHYEVGH